MICIDDSNKFKVLAAIYSFYDQLLKGFPLACGPGCHVCCTVNIVATSLEAGHLLRSSFFDDLDLKKLLSSATTGSVYRPSLSTNQIADLCLRQEEIPSDRVEHGEGVCPVVSMSTVPLHAGQCLQGRSANTVVRQIWSLFLLQ
ncbi:MAG: hypothetical protein JRF43_03130 [Deltaproteobacteria bacterium]|nr:hypothetical protein [Deltaproteobacteria bacterium]